MLNKISVNNNLCNNYFHQQKRNKNMLTRKPCCRKETARCHKCSFPLKFANINNIHYKYKTSQASKAATLQSRDLRSFVIRFDFESYVRFKIQFVLMVRFEIFESSALSIVIHKETMVVVKFAFKVDFGSKISVQQHCLTRFMTELK